VSAFSGDIEMDRRRKSAWRAKMKWARSICRWHRDNGGIGMPTHVFPDGTVFFAQLLAREAA
jgi:hypothetical protein